MPEPARCAYCRQQPQVHAFRPFCSERCKMADLGRWLSEDYRLADPSSAAGLDPDDAGADEDR